MRAALVVAAFSLLAVGLYLMFSTESNSSSPQPHPSPAVSIGPDGAEPAWTHVCLGTDDEPSWCEDI